jgi:hypothetical protein
MLQAIHLSPEFSADFVASERKQRSTEICIELAIQINLPERPTAKRYPFGLGMAEESSE